MKQNLLWLLLVLWAAAAALALAGEALQAPKTFKSNSGKKRLDLVLVAKPFPAHRNFPNHNASQVWHYHACARTFADQMDCPASTYSPHGLLLQLERGDLVKIRLVNRLPQWHTNLHFHGFAVSTAYNEHTFGDYSLVTAYNSKVENNVSKADMKLPMILKKDFIDYQFVIPQAHPLGLYWFHPHNHEMEVVDGGNEFMMNAGLSGAISIGNPKKYVGNIGNVPQHVLVLRSTFYLGNGALVASPNPAFCNYTTPLPGYCLEGAGGGIEYISVNGQVFPELVVRKKTGSIFRLVQALGSSNLIISLVDDASKEQIPFQVLWADGASMRSTSVNLVDSVFFMPGSRMEIFVPASLRARSAKLVGTGPTVGILPGFSYPNVLLASVKFQGGGGKPKRGPVIKSDGGSVLKAMERPPRTDVTCNGTAKLLPENHRRRIGFGFPANSTTLMFALSYAEVDENGQIVPGTQTPMQVFNASQTTICTKLGTTEIWELDNFTNEDHNFHIHQTKFTVLQSTSIRPGYSFPQEGVDSVPLPPFSRTVVQIPFVRSGLYVYHCHLSFHSDFGMMAAIQVADRMD